MLNHIRFAFNIDVQLACIYFTLNWLMTECRTNENGGHLKNMVKWLEILKIHFSDSIQSNNYQKGYDSTGV